MASENDVNPVEYLDNSELSDSFARARALEILDARPGMSVAAIGAEEDLSVSVLESLTSDGQLFHIEAGARETRLPQHCCDRVLISHVWTTLEDPVGTLHEVRRILRPNGRLVIIERSAEIGFPELLQTLERNGWDVHRHGETDEKSYFVEAGATDESVKS